VIMKRRIVRLTSCRDVDVNKIIDACRCDVAEPGQ